MFSMKTDTHLFTAMEQWIERGENDKVKYILEKTAITDLSTADDEHLLHVAAIHGNLNIVEHLINMGCEVDLKDSLNQTPLNLAVGNQRPSVAKFLLEQNADIFQSDMMRASSPFRKIVCNDEPNFEVLQMFLDNVKNKCANKNEFVDILVSNSCRLSNIVRLRDAEITEMFMNKPNADLSEPGWEGSSVDIAMNSIDQENMRILLNHNDHGLATRRSNFIFCFRIVLQEYTPNNSLPCTVDFAVQQFVKWQLVDDVGTTLHVETIYRILPEFYLRPMLSDSVVSYLKTALNYDIRMQLFGNSNCCVQEMIERGEVDMNLIGRKGRSTLHIAVHGGVTHVVVYLLDKGMSPNVREDNGKTPLFKVHYNGSSSVHCFVHLLQYGADLQATDNSGNTYMDCYHSPDFSHDLIIIVIAHLAILQVTGVPLKESFRNFLDANEEALDYFMSCCQQLEQMKTVEVFNSLTLFEILTGNFEMLTRRARPLPRTILRKFFAPQSTGLQDYDPYYKSTVSYRVTRAALIGRLRERAQKIIADSIEVLKTFDLIIERIVSFLSHYDLGVFRIQIN